jgi:NAD(P)H dehydrogenase (quinone)
MSENVNFFTTVLVTGASGNVGRAIAESLLAMAPQWRLKVKIGVRNHEKVQDLIYKGAQPVIIDFEDSASLAEALTDVDRVWVTLPNPAREGSHPFDRARLTMNVVDAAAQAGVHFVLLGSVPFADLQKTLFQKEFFLAETHLKNSQLNHAVLRMGLFMENALALKRMIANGVLPHPLGAASYCPVSVADIGEAAATILANPARYTNETFTITGPESVSGIQMAAAASRALGKHVSYLNAPPKAIYQVFGDVGMPEWQVGGILELFDLFRMGIANTPTNDFEIITNKKGTSFEQCVSHLRSVGAV